MRSPSPPLRVLLIEDNAGDVRLLRALLDEMPDQPFRLELVKSLAAALARLTRGGVDALLLDLGLPDSRGLATLERLRAQVPQLPIVILSGQDDEQLALRAVRAGAQDYLLKGRVDGQLLVRAVRYAVERQEIRQALRRSEHQLRVITDSVPALISYVDRYQRYRFANRGYVDWFGQTRAAVEGQPMWAVLGEAAYATIRPYVERALAGETVSFEAWVPYRAGGQHCIAAVYTPDYSSDGQVDGFFALVLDITARKDAEQAQARLAAIVESSTDAIYSKTLDGLVTSWNPGAERLYGYRADEMLGQPFERLVPPDRLGEYRAALQRIQNGERIPPWDTVRRHRAGHQLEVNVTLSPIVDASGECIGISVMARDIADRKRLERLQQEFLAMVSHELRNPLTGIRGYAQLMRVRQAYSPQIVEAIERQTSKLDRLISDLLDSARLEAGRLELRRTRVDLAALARSAAKQAQAQSERHVVLVESPPHPVEGWWDPDRLEQVLQNLLSNALKYAPQGGEVLVQVGQEGDWAQLSVTDQGMGIAPELLPRLFERFQRVASSHDHGTRGIGLGCTSPGRWSRHTAAASRSLRSRAVAAGSRSASQPPVGRSPRLEGRQLRGPSVPTSGALSSRERPARDCWSSGAALRIPFAQLPTQAWISNPRPGRSRSACSGRRSWPASDALLRV